MWEKRAHAAILSEPTDMQTSEQASQPGEGRTSQWITGSGEGVTSEGGPGSHCGLSGKLGRAEHTGPMLGWQVGGEAPFFGEDSALRKNWHWVI